MKRHAIDMATPIEAEETGWWTTLQIVKTIIVLNIYYNKNLQARHCINPLTREYENLSKGIWSKQKIENAYGVDVYSYHADDEMRKKGKMSNEDNGKIKQLLAEHYDKCMDRYGVIACISRIEYEYEREKRENTEINRINRVNAMMERVPKMPDGIKEWIDKKELNEMDFCIKDRETKHWTCSACGKEFDDPQKTEGKGKPKDNDMVICSKCGKKIRILTRKKSFETRTHFCIIQPIDNEISVARHCSTSIICEPKCKKQIDIEEDIRLILFKGKRKKDCEIYYQQYYRGSYFDNKSNRINKRYHAGYLYEGKIADALNETEYEPLEHLFTQMAAAGMKLNYNAMMYARKNQNYIRLIEMLFRGRFYKLLAEESDSLHLLNMESCRELKLCGGKIEDIFNIKDKQKINRIREKNGGNMMIRWMRWSELHRQKISDKALEWLKMNQIEPSDMEWIKCRLSIEQAVNYIERQKKESYCGKTACQVISQYEDYMRMCKKLKKDTADELIYKPRELKRRHNEAVAEMEYRNAEIKAEEYSEKFGEAEAVLREIKEKYEYHEKEYSILVPERIADIVADGNYLHHCAGTSERYFDRIKQHETYICLLRKTEDIKIPFYTIEVEPGGTIRQHRGMFDEEPDIEKVRPFLKKWQQEIKKRMREQDHDLAKISKQKREENIEDLKKKNNTRVLEGLREDFMEAI